MQGFGVVPFHAVRNNEVVAVSTRTRAVAHQARNTRQCGQLIVVSVACFLIHHYDGTWDFISILGQCLRFFESVAQFFENVFVSLGTNERGITPITHGSVSFLRQTSYFKLVVSPVQKTSVSSFEKRSFSRMTVVPSSSSSNLSTSLIDCQCAMCRVSPSPKMPLSIPAVQSNPTCPPCKGVSGRPLTSACCAKSTAEAWR